jgi:hypothetical protein
MEKGEAERFAECVNMMRSALATAMDRTNPEGPLNLKRLQGARHIPKQREDAVRVWVQMLQVEDEPVRAHLVDLLKDTKGARASAELARRAVADPSPKVRAQARKALKDRKAEEYQQVLVQYLNYPLEPVAANAAETLVELNVKEAVRALVEMLKGPDAMLPRMTDCFDEPQTVVPQVVRINHLKGCLLCHAPAGDSARRGGGRAAVGAVPRPGQSVPPMRSEEYYSKSDLLVRADVTFLRQDFSVMQPVENAKPWPSRQRFDFVVRLQPVSGELAERLTRQHQAHGISEHRRIVLYTLQRLTGGNVPSGLRAWHEQLASSRK